MILDTEFLKAKDEPSDINEHVDYFRSLAAECGHITEMGVRYGVSTMGWIKGLQESSKTDRRLICFDIQYLHGFVIDKLNASAVEAGVNITINKANSLEVTIEPTDLLFIDTRHNYKQLRQELDLHGNKARKYIVMHDTTIFGAVDDPDDETPEGEKQGLLTAVDEFLTLNSEWELHAVRPFNNGVVTLKRRDPRVVIMGTYPNTPERMDLLKRSLAQVNKLGLEVILVSHMALPENIAQMATHVIYDKQNEFFCREELDQFIGPDSPYFHYWTKSVYLRSITPPEREHSFCVYTLMLNAFSLAFSLGKKWAYYLESDFVVSDQDLASFQRLYDEVLAQKKLGYFQFNGNFSKINVAFFIVSVPEFYKRVPQFRNKLSYLKYYKDHYYLEAAITQCFEPVKENLCLKEADSYNFALLPTSECNGSDVSQGTPNYYQKSDLIPFENSTKWVLFSVPKLPGEMHYRWSLSNPPRAGEYVADGGVNSLKMVDVFDEEEITGEAKFTVEVKYKDGWTPLIDYRISPSWVERVKARSYLKYREQPPEVEPKPVEVVATTAGLTPEFDGLEIRNARLPDKVNYNFWGGARVSIDGSSSDEYLVEFINRATGKKEFQSVITPGHWCKPARTYYTEWEINVFRNGEPYSNYTLELEGRTVYIAIDSTAVGDTLAWFPAVVAFKLKHKCAMVCSTFHNDLFEEQYPDIKFIKPGESIFAHAQYTIGCFDLSNDGASPVKHNKVPLTTLAYSLLGLEIPATTAPRIKVVPQPKGKFVCIATESTAQAKYWNNPHGWRKLTEYLTKAGYKVINLSLNAPKLPGVENVKGSLSEIAGYLAACEFFVGLSSGLSWLAWAAGQQKICLISGFTYPWLEFSCLRIMPGPNICSGCYNRHVFDKGDWNWCPDHKNTPRQFECSRTITSGDVISKIKGAAWI